MQSVPEKYLALPRKWMEPPEEWSKQFCELAEKTSLGKYLASTGAPRELLPKAFYTHASPDYLTHVRQSGLRTLLQNLKHARLQLKRTLSALPPIQAHIRNAQDRRHKLELENLEKGLLGQQQEPWVFLPPFGAAQLPRDIDRLAEDLREYGSYLRNCERHVSQLLSGSKASRTNANSAFLILHGFFFPFLNAPYDKDWADLWNSARQAHGQRGRLNAKSVNELRRRHHLRLSRAERAP